MWRCREGRGAGTARDAGASLRPGRSCSSAPQSPRMSTEHFAIEDSRPLAFRQAREGHLDLGQLEHLLGRILLKRVDVQAAALQSPRCVERDRGEPGPRIMGDRPGLVRVEHRGRRSARRPRRRRGRGVRARRAGPVRLGVAGTALEIGHSLPMSRLEGSANESKEERATSAEARARPRETSADIEVRCRSDRVGKRPGEVRANVRLGGCPLVPARRTRRSVVGEHEYPRVGNCTPARPRLCCGPPLALPQTLW